MTQPPTASRQAAYEILCDCVAGRTHKLARTLDRIFNDELRAVGLRNTQLTILSVIAHMGEVTPGALTAILVMDKSTVSRNLRVMRDNGWIEVVDSADTGRPARLTNAGRRRLHRALPVWRRAQRQADAILGNEGMRLLQRLGDAVGEIPPEHAIANADEPATG